MTLFTLALVLVAAVPTPEQARFNALERKMKDAYGEASLMYGRFAEAEKAFDEYFAAARKANRPIAFRQKNRMQGFGPLEVGRLAKWALHREADLRELCAYGAGHAATPADAYEFRLTAALAPLKGTPEEIAAKLAGVEPRLAKGIADKDRLERLRFCASAASAANDEAILRGVKLYLERVHPTPEKRVYTVGYSAKAVDSTTLASAPGDVLARNYGGSADVFVTDVASGDRGASAEASKTRAVMRILADDWGVHFSFTDPDEQARAMYEGAVKNTTYEIFIAPGAEEPYAQILFGATDDFKTVVMNTQYDNGGYRRLDTGNPAHFRRSCHLADGGLVTEVSIAWEVWADKVPAENAEWDFEVCHWGRTGNAAWNGIRRTHGRSLYGKLRFALSKKDRAAILRRQLGLAIKAFDEEKSPWSERGGRIDRWADAVMGDPAFNDEEVRPLVAELDTLAVEIRAGVSDARVLELAGTALPKFRYVTNRISVRRVGWLRRKLEDAR